MTQTKVTATVLEQANRTIQSTRRRDLVGTVLRNSAHGRLSFTTCGLLANAIHAEVVKPLETERDALLSEVAKLREAVFEAWTKAILLVDTAPLCHCAGKQYVDPVALVQRMNAELEDARAGKEQVTG